MNKPISQPIADPDIGPLDEHGQQIWSADEAEAIMQAISTSAHRRTIAHARAEAAAGHVLSHEEHLAAMTEMKRRWHAEHAG